MTTRALKRTLIRQFGRPTGILGRLAGWIMAIRPSNRQRNAWTVEQLRVDPGDRVLEIGFGPGVALAELLRHSACGQAVGIDHSAAMVAQAHRRNRAAVRTGKLQLIQASVDDIAGKKTEVGGPFDKIFGVNVFMFWKNPERVFRTLRSKLASATLKRPHSMQ